MVKKVPYTEMRFFFCTHAQLYDLPTRRPTLWGRPPRWQLFSSKPISGSVKKPDEKETLDGRPSGVGRLVGSYFLLNLLVEVSKSLMRKKGKDNVQTLANFSAAHRCLKEKCQLGKTSYTK